MHKLIAANGARLRQYRVFWLTLGGVLLVSLLYMWNCSRTVAEMAAAGFVSPLEKSFFAMAPYMGVVYAAFISLFLSAELADGAVRNKLIIGHTRRDVYLADYLVCLGACLAFAGMWFLGGLPGLVWIGPFSMQAGEVLTWLLVAVGFTAAFTALFVLVSLLSDNKAAAVILTLALWLGLVLAAGALYDRLQEPEMTGGVMYADGAFQEVAPEPNPLYLSGWARTACTWLLDLLPAGQALLMHGAEITAPARQILCSLLFTGLVLWAGIRAFQRKEIK